MSTLPGQDQYKKEGVYYFVNKRNESFKIDIVTSNTETMHKVYQQLVGEIGKDNLQRLMQSVDFENPFEIDIMEGEELAAILTCEYNYFIGKPEGQFDDLTPAQLLEMCKVENNNPKPWDPNEPFKQNCKIV